MALSHIHRPQIVGKAQLRYSGSPIQLSFSEKDDQKEVVLLELDENKFKANPIKIPQFRKLVSFRGTVEEVRSKMENYRSQSVLCDLAELTIEEENENIEHIRALEELHTKEQKNGIQILKGRIEFKNLHSGTSQILKPGEDINSFTPVELFEKRLEQDASLEDRTELINAFKDILESLEADSENV